jgi:hypothetical protein
MTWFDHVRCHSCRAMLDPEALTARTGLTCPQCGAALSLPDLFGVSAAFSEEEEPQVSLDDLVAGPRTPPPPPAPDPRSSPEPGPSTALAAMRKLMKKG